MPLSPSRLLCCLAGLVLGLSLPVQGEILATGDIRAELQKHLHHLSVTIGERSIYRPAHIKAAEDYVFQQFEAMGYQPRRQQHREGRVAEGHGRDAAGDATGVCNP